MDNLKNEIVELKAQLATMEPGTMGYSLVQIEIKEKELFLDSLSRLI